jgi:hypothetical protein
VSRVPEKCAVPECSDAAQWYRGGCPVPLCVKHARDWQRSTARAEALRARVAGPCELLAKALAERT